MKHGLSFLLAMIVVFCTLSSVIATAYAEYDKITYPNVGDVVKEQVKTFECGAKNTIEKSEDFVIVAPKIYYSIGDDYIDVVSKYGENTDIVTRLQKYGQNNIFDFFKLSTIENSANFSSSDISNAVAFQGFGTDLHGPFTMKALNNIDGDTPDYTTWTGGCHGYTFTDDAGNSVTIPSGRTATIRYFADGKEVTEGNGYCSELEIRWTNYNQASNTRKKDGTGREVLQENHVLVFDGREWQTSVELIPLEDIYMAVWYGFQMYGTRTTYPKIRYVDGTNKSEYIAADGSSCGNNLATKFIIYGEVHRCEVEIDPCYDLGDRSMYTGDSGIFSTTIGKVYFNIISKQNLEKGNIYALRGKYKFMPVCYAMTEPISSMGHNYSTEWIVDVEPTCTKNGSKHIECTVCGTTLETSTILATGHTKSDWKISVDSTCTEKGSKYIDCTVCGEVLETKEISAKGHTEVKDAAVEATCTETGLTEGSHCSVCNTAIKAQETVAAKGHTSNCWKTDKKATVDAAGKKHKECTECGEILKTATIKQLKCSKPSLKKIENTKDGVKITWGKVTGADSYVVYRKTGSGSYKKIATVKGNSKVTYTDKSAKSGKKYYYNVKAVNEAGSSEASKAKSILYLADTTLSTPKSTKSGITLKWKKITGADGYYVYRKTGSGSYSKIATVKGNAKVTYTDKKASKGKTYTYKIKAYKGKTTSAYSNTKKIKDKF